VALAVDPRIESLLAAARGQVTAGNAQRNQDAIMAALGLTGSGLFERASAVQQGSASAGFAEAPELQNLTYGFKLGPEGRLFRDAHTGLNAAAGARGVTGGSGLQNQQLLARRSLLQQATQQQRAFDAGQSQSLMSQGQGLSSLAQGVADIRFDQAREAAAQQALTDQQARDAAAASAAAGGNATTGVARPAPAGTLTPLQSATAMRNRVSRAFNPPSLGSLARRNAVQQRNRVAVAVRR
jgi:hypothetical protein